jgi:hypothetical protein
MIETNNHKLKHLIYYSVPTTFDEETIKEILLKSRQNNAQSNVTGALICRSDLYFQYLEGPIDEVNKTFKKIELDNRHKNIQKIKEDETTRRLFASWAMREDPVKSWMWTRIEVKAGILTRVKPKEAFEVFERLSREVDQFDQEL